MATASGTRYRDIGLLFLRVSIGIMFILHGLPKLSGGPEVWEKVGGVMGMFGIGFGFVIWGFLAAIIETLGGLLFMLGLYFKQTCALLAVTMLVAFLMHFTNGDPFNVYSHALESFFLFFSFIFIGPGSMSVQKK